MVLCVCRSVPALYGLYFLLFRDYKGNLFLIIGHNYFGNFEGRVFARQINITE